MTRIPLAICVCLAAACVPDRPGGRSVDARLVDDPCVSEVRSTLRGWGGDAGVAAEGPGSFGLAARRVPTRAFGTWILVSASDRGASIVSLVTPDSLTVRRYLAGCAASDRSGPRSSLASAGAERLTDQGLTAEISASPKAIVVYVWSPHMPLSVDGYAEITTAATALGWRVIPVLMPQSDDAFARREAVRVGIPLAGLREADANELVFRDALVHAPAIVVFRDNHVSPVLPGYRNAASYRRYLEAFAADRGWHRER